jgi:hypothetical protein
MASIVFQQYFGRGTVLAWLPSASPGGRIWSHSMAAKWNFVVLVSLEFWLADNGDLDADFTALALDRAAAAKHICRYHHSWRVQRGWLFRRGKRSRRLGEVPVAAAALPRVPSQIIIAPR